MQESNSRRNNLIFDGITEQQQENTLLVLKHFLISTLRFSTQECNSLLIASCHRIGRFQKGKNRPIIAKFVLDTERNKVWMQKSLLKNTSYVLREDYPSEIENRRKLMYPLFLEAKQKDQKSRLNGDKVVYMGKSYGYAQAPELAQVLNFYKKGIRKGNGVTAFYGRKSIYSNFFPCFFQGRKYIIQL